MLVEDHLDMIEVIEQGYKDDYKWVNQSFISSIRKQLDKGKWLSTKQQTAIENIYKGSN